MMCKHTLIEVFSSQASNIMLFQFELDEYAFLLLTGERKAITTFAIDRTRFQSIGQTVARAAALNPSTEHVHIIH